MFQNILVTTVLKLHSRFESILVKPSFYLINTQSSNSTFLGIEVARIVDSIMTPENAGLTHGEMLQQCGMRALKALQTVPAEKLAAIDARLGKAARFVQGESS